RFGVSMPMIVPRARFRVLDEKANGLLQKMKLSAADIERPYRDLLAHAARAAGAGAESSSGALRARLFSGLEGSLDALAHAATVADKTLERPATKTKAAALGAIDKLFVKYDRALAQNDRVLTDRIARLRALLAP